MHSHGIHLKVGAGVLKLLDEIMLLQREGVKGQPVLHGLSLDFLHRCGIVAKCHCGSWECFPNEQFWSDMTRVPSLTENGLKVLYQGPLLCQLQLIFQLIDPVRGPGRFLGALRCARPPPAVVGG